MIRKILVALVSSLFFSTALALIHYAPESQQQPDTYDWPYFSLVMIYLIYATPAYLVGGVPASMLIEDLNRSIAWINPVVVYLFRLLAYGLVGALIMKIYQLVISAGGVPIHRSLWSQGYGLGIAASLVYLHVWLVSFLFVKKKRAWSW